MNPSEEQKGTAVPPAGSAPAGEGRETPAALKPDTTMPKLGLSPEEARDLVAYLYSQPFNPGR